MRGAESEQRAESEGFAVEARFEDAMIAALRNKGWGAADVLMSPTTDDLVENWRRILSRLNARRDCLGAHELTAGEMRQVLDTVRALRTPVRLNREFINAPSVSIVRDNPADTAHLGRTVSLIIYDRQKIGAADTVYQIARQPRFATRSEVLGERRGDFSLLINGMPLIHVELKRSGVHVACAVNQIERYLDQGVFSGLWSLVQVFVAMNPGETLYFANPGGEVARVDRSRVFHWGDFNNDVVGRWRDIAESLLSIPMAHQLIGYYTVPDTADGTLKVMRSYQYFAARQIYDRVQRRDWSRCDQPGGHVWHTTGSGKTLTSFKSAQLIAQSDGADKVVFLVDRVELGAQSYQSYQGFADDSADIQDTASTDTLIRLLRSDDRQHRLVITSIQKMSRVNEQDLARRTSELDEIRQKRIVFIVDEAHRSVFGDMYPTIKQTFPMALFFGFTGTPIFHEHPIRGNTTTTLFGSELHRYVMPDGIRDGNVLGFDLVKVATYKDADLRRAMALKRVHAATEAGALADATKREAYARLMRTDMTEVEAQLPATQYDRREHRQAVADDIMSQQPLLSLGGRYHAILATTSIAEAMDYYNLIKDAAQGALHVTALFDPSIDEDGGAIDKQRALEELIVDYNRQFDSHYTLATWAAMKHDISDRIAHRESYRQLPAGGQIDLLIVVNQMLTGFDSKWVNTLYLDKYMDQDRAHDIIQAISRTNRPCGPDKPHGTIRYYRKVHTMSENICHAIELYSGNRAASVYADPLPDNIKGMDARFADIEALFGQAHIQHFQRLPQEAADRGRFARLFRELSHHLNAALLQGFTWDKPKFTREDYLTLAQRYDELATAATPAGTSPADVPYDIDPHLTETEAGTIDYDYINSRYERVRTQLRDGNTDRAQIERTLDELHRAYAALPQEEQHYADLFLDDVRAGRADYDIRTTFHDHIILRMSEAREDHIQWFARQFGLDAGQLRQITDLHPTEQELNQDNRYDNLKSTIDPELARAHFTQQSGRQLSTLDINMRLDTLLRDFILHGKTDTTATRQRTPTHT